MPHESVVQLFAEEFPNQSIEQLYSEFDPTPIAAASIAQVHSARATRRSCSGREAPVPELAQRVSSGIYSPTSWYSSVRSSRSLSFHLSWVHDEIGDNLTKELDFLNEAA